MKEEEICKILGRSIRHESLDKLGVPTWTLAREAIKSGNIKQALELMEAARTELKQRHDSLGHMLGYIASFVAQTYGEDQVGVMWETIGRQHILSTPVYQLYPPEVRVLLAAESQRGHGSGKTGLGDITITEEVDRYVMKFHPCATGGMMRLSDTCGRTKKAYPWSWGQVGVPYYCVHCCTMGELLAIETYGYPMAVYESGNWRDDPCIRYIYKKPELIPEKYFKRVGKKREPAKFKT